MVRIVYFNFLERDSIVCAEMEHTIEFWLAYYKRYYDVALMLAKRGSLSFSAVICSVLLVR